jgi:hypothetical protein
VTSVVDGWPFLSNRCLRPSTGLPEECELRLVELSQLSYTPSYFFEIPHFSGISENHIANLVNRVSSSHSRRSNGKGGPSHRSFDSPLLAHSRKIADGNFGNFRNFRDFCTFRSRSLSVFHLSLAPRPSASEVLGPGRTTARAFGDRGLFPTLRGFHPSTLQLHFYRSSPNSVTRVRKNVMR